MFSALFGLFFLYLCGTAGCILFRRFHLPLPALLGSLTVTAILALTGHFPPASDAIEVMSTLCKIAIGVMMGRRISRDALRMIARIIGPALLISVWMILLSVISGVMLSWLANIPLSTALVGCATGGLNEMAIFALSQNYDVATITVIQTFRLVGVLALTPWLVRKWSSRLAAKGQLHSSIEDVQTTEEDIRFFSRSETALLIFLAVGGGLAFQSWGIPAGAMLGALTLSGGMGVVRDKSYPFPRWIASAAQIGIGIAIAQQFKPEQAEMLLNVRFLLSVAFSTVFVIAATLLLGYLLQKMTRWNPLTCLLSSSAGGFTQMVLVAEEMRADSLTIGVLHLTRYLAIVSCMPFLIMYLLP